MALSASYPSSLMSILTQLWCRADLDLGWYWLLLFSGFTYKRIRISFCQNLRDDYIFEGLDILQLHYFPLGLGLSMWLWYFFWLPQELGYNYLGQDSPLSLLRMLGTEGQKFSLLLPFSGCPESHRIHLENPSLRLGPADLRCQLRSFEN
jgi:hypothetical protein